MTTRLALAALTLAGLAGVGCAVGVVRVLHLLDED